MSPSTSTVPDDHRTGYCTSPPGRARATSTPTTTVDRAHARLLAMAALGPCHTVGRSRASNSRRVRTPTFP